MLLVQAADLCLGALDLYGEVLVLKRLLVNLVGGERLVVGLLEALYLRVQLVVDLAELAKLCNHLVGLLAVERHVVLLGDPCKGVVDACKLFVHACVLGACVLCIECEVLGLLGKLLHRGPLKALEGLAEQRKLGVGLLRLLPQLAHLEGDELGALGVELESLVDLAKLALRLADGCVRRLERLGKACGVGADLDS